MPDILAPSAARNSMSGSVGGDGYDIIQDTSAHTGNWKEIYFFNDTVFAVLTDANGVGTVTTVTFIQGTKITGRFTAITLTSGQVLAIRGA
jgi:hypothetical protein